jgi:hypothetical protein
VSIQVTQGDNVVNAIPIFVSPSQVNAIMPSNAPVGPASLELALNNARSNPVPVSVAKTLSRVIPDSNRGMLYEFAMDRFGTVLRTRAFHVPVRKFRGRLFWLDSYIDPPPLEPGDSADS